MIHGQVYQIFLPEDAYEEYQQELNPFKSLSFAEKVSWLEKFNKNNHSNRQERAEAYKEKQKEIIILLLIQEVNIDGDLCSLIHFRDITHSFQHRHVWGHIEFESMMQKNIKNLMIDNMLHYKKSIKFIQENDDDSTVFKQIKTKIID